jgi:AmmeMemoRadiSam system protein B
MSTTRRATHAGSWYTASKSQLSRELDAWLDHVDVPVKPIGKVSSGEASLTVLPVPGARVIIAPLVCPFIILLPSSNILPFRHAGYSYSGPAAAWAYRSWDVSKAKRIFILGPSHHFYLTKCALSKCVDYETPLGHLAIDKQTTKQLYDTGNFQYMSQSVDEDEHSLEMHLPYIYKILSRYCKSTLLPLQTHPPPTANSPSTHCKFHLTAINHH